MKNLFKYMFAAALSAAAMTACSTDATEEAVAPELEGKTYNATIVASFSDDTRTALNDGESVQWEAGDVLSATAYRSTPNEWDWNRTSAALETGGTTATFSFTGIQYDETTENLWFYSGHEGGTARAGILYMYHDGSFTQTQSEAGVMNHKYLMLLSDVTSWEEVATLDMGNGGTGSVDKEAVKMGLYGSILRFIPYISTDDAELQASIEAEKVVSIELRADVNVTGRSIYKPAFGTWDIDQKISQDGGTHVAVALDEPFALSGVTSKENSAGIYLAMPPIDDVVGYSYVVTTDKALYTFDGSSKTLELTKNNGKLVNVFLNLKNASKTSLEDLPDKVIGFAGSVADKTLEGTAQENVDLGWWLAYVDGVEQRAWNSFFVYTESQFICVSLDDYNNGKFDTPVDWMTCDYKREGEEIVDCVWLLDVKENPGAERSGVVICNFPEKDGYVYQEGQNKRVAFITQKANLTLTAELTNVYNGTVSATGEEISAATLTLTVNGEAVADVAAAMETYGVTVTAGAAEVSVAANGAITLDVPANAYNQVKEYKLQVKAGDDLLASATINQAAGEGEMPTTCAYTYDLELGENPRGWGTPANTKDGGNAAFIRNVQKDGVTVTLTQEIADEVLAFAFRSSAPSVEEMEAYKAQSAERTASATAVEMYVRWFGGVQIDVATSSSNESGAITKITAYNPDGTEAGYYMVWVN